MGEPTKRTFTCDIRSYMLKFEGDDEPYEFFTLFLSEDNGEPAQIHVDRSPEAAGQTLTKFLLSKTVGLRAV